MNILYVLNSGSPGGMEKQVLDLTIGMTKQGHKIYVWCKKGSYVKAYESAGAEIYINEIKYDIDPTYILSLKRFLSDKKIDVIHTHELKAGVNGLLAGVLARVPVKITHIHTPISEWQVSGRFKKILTFISGRCYSILVNFFSSSEVALTESRKNTKVQEGVKENKLRVIPNGIDFARYEFSSQIKLEHRNEIISKHSIPENTLIIGNVSRTTEEKGHILLINAFADLVNSEPKFKDKLFLLLAGGGRLEDKIRARIKSLNMENRIVLTGIFSEEDQIKYYATFDIFVFPSLAEGFGYVLVEAMASNLPVLSSDLDVLKEVGGDTIMYFRSNDKNDLMLKLKEICEIYGESKYTFVETALRKVKKDYSMERFVANYTNLYMEFLK